MLALLQSSCAVSYGASLSVKHARHHGEAHIVAFKDVYFEKTSMLISSRWSCPIIHLEVHQKKGKTFPRVYASMARPSQPWMLVCHMKEF